MLPTEKEINAKTEKIFIGKSIKTVLHERYYQKGFRNALDYLTSKFTDFTEDEMKAIEMDDEDDDDDCEETEPDYYSCMCCGNIQQRSYSCNKCAGPMSECWY